MSDFLTVETTIRGVSGLFVAANGISSDAGMGEAKDRGRQPTSVRMVTYQRA